MNDTFLSDWRGVIGKEIDRQQELEAQIEEMSEELEAQKRHREVLESQVDYSELLNDAENRIKTVEQELNEMLLARPFKVSTKPPKPKRQDILVDCPSCKKPNSVRVRPKKGSRKLFECSECKCLGQVRYQEGGLRQVLPIPVSTCEVECPTCKTRITEELPEFPSAMKQITCERCQSDLLLSRRANGTNVKLKAPGKAVITDSLVQEVLDKLPSRPWPQGIHKTIAKELNLSNSMVSRIVEKLIAEEKIEPGQNGER